MQLSTTSRLSCMACLLLPSLTLLGCLACALASTELVSVDSGKILVQHVIVFISTHACLRCIGYTLTCIRYMGMSRCSTNPRHWTTSVTCCVCQMNWMMWNQVRLTATVPTTVAVVRLQSVCIDFKMNWNFRQWVRLTSVLGCGSRKRLTQTHDQQLYDTSISEAMCTRILSQTFNDLLLTSESTECHWVVRVWNDFE